MASAPSEIVMRFRVLLEPVDAEGKQIEGQPLLRGDVVEVPLQVTYGRPPGPTYREDVRFGTRTVEQVERPASAGVRAFVERDEDSAATRRAKQGDPQP